MSGEVEGSRSAGVPPAFLNLATSRNARSGLARLALHKHLMWSAGACLPRASKGSHFLRRGLPRLYSTLVSSRIRSNLLKTNDGRHSYPSQNREDNFPVFGPTRGEKFHSTFFTMPVRSKLSRESNVQEPRPRWLAQRSK